ncbi:GNAT family N-acetyltransferase [Allobranchiibius sp. GilTou73]|uniref:GNAT family N-acetyltransferase n=1 Tax=Allobranchiibius sp. GilTou73 TaxID=2904523 RepID=UPI001F254119|nr:GNAT family N-acetyltransferase [Allobranchiibius sp. GilTou73]UIJ33405.1 GNAT family N-acetyltransferase [Allobranchiibius sp. GilTou73]
MTAAEVSQRVQIREAVGDDLLGVIEVGRQTWPITYGPIAGDDYVAMGLAKWWTADATIPAIRSGRATVAAVGDQIIGVSVVGPLGDEIALWKLYVLPEHQGSGVGSRLLRTAISRATDDGWKSMVLSYLDGNENAAGFYAHFGFDFYERETAGSGVPDSIWVRRVLREDA